MPSASLSPSPKLQFFDANGNPLVGGKLYSYAAGTSTPLATFAGSNGIISNPNPTILDSRGEAGVWLDAAAYKLTLKDSADVEIWTVDNITSTEAVKAYAKAYTDALKADLADTSNVALGDAMIGFKQSNSSGVLTGAVAGTVHKKLQEIVSVIDFGAKGDGLTDDAAAIQAAINALPATGGTVYLPPGNYLIKSVIKIGNGTATTASSRGGVTLMGASPPQANYIFGGYTVTQSATQLTWGGGADAMVQIDGPLQGWSVQNIGFDGGGTAVYCLYCISGQIGYVNNLSMFNYHNAGYGSTTRAGGGSPTNKDSFRNSLNNITIKVPNIANAIGIYLNGDVTGGDTDVNTLNNITIELPQLATATQLYGMVLENCDTNYFNNIHIIAAGAFAPNYVGILFNYGGGVGWPANNILNGVELGNTPNPYVIVGSPGGFGPNATILNNVPEGNGGLYPKVDCYTNNIEIDLPRIVSNYLALTKTAALGATPLYNVHVEGFCRVNVYMKLTAQGTGGSIHPVVLWDDGTAQSAVLPVSLLTTQPANTTVCSYTFPVYCAVNTTVTVATGFVGVTGNPEYKIWASVERMA